jgi:hypothetical protein
MSSGVSGNALQMLGLSLYILQRLPLASWAGQPWQHLPHLAQTPLLSARHFVTWLLLTYQKTLLLIHPSNMPNHRIKLSRPMQYLHDDLGYTIH